MPFPPHTHLLLTIYLKLLPLSRLVVFFLSNGKHEAGVRDGLGVGLNQVDEVPELFPAPSPSNCSTAWPSDATRITRFHIGRVWCVCVCVCVCARASRQKRSRARVVSDHTCSPPIAGVCGIYFCFVLRRCDTRQYGAYWVF